MNKRNWAPYLLILPSLIYLALFFAWPMVQALGLAVWDDDRLLVLLEEPQRDGATSGRLPQGAQVTILDRQGNQLSPEDIGEANLLTERWFRISGEDESGAAIEGWTSESRIRVRQEADDGTPLGGTVRPRLGADADEYTNLYAEANEGSEVIGRLLERA